jgi:hypothetical protein
VEPPECVTVFDLVDLPVYDKVVVTVIVTPVGKVVVDTEPVPIGEEETVLDHTGDLDGDTETDPEMVGVFD